MSLLHVDGYTCNKTCDCKDVKENPLYLFLALPILVRCERHHNLWCKDLTKELYMDQKYLLTRKKNP